MPLCMAGRVDSEATSVKWMSITHTSGIENANPARLLDALKNRSIGFSFSGGGFLLPYYLGNLQALIQLNLLRPGTTHVGGSSAGSLVAAIVACGLPMDTVISSVKEMFAECRTKGVFRRLGAGLKAQLETLLPSDAHERCSGTCHIAVTKVQAYGALHSKRVSHFRSREDLLEALMASCHLPLISNGSMTMRFRGKVVIDGGVTDLMPVPAEPHHVVKITCLPLDSITRMPMRFKSVAQKHISISPCKFRKWPYSHSQMTKYMLGPGPEAFVEFLLEAGQKDIFSWAQATGLPVDAPSPAPAPVLKPVNDASSEHEAQDLTPTSVCNSNVSVDGPPSATAELPPSATTELEEAFSAGRAATLG